MNVDLNKILSESARPRRRTHPQEQVSDANDNCEYCFRQQDNKVSVPSVIRSDVRGRAMTRSAARMVMTGGRMPTDPYHYKLIKDRLDMCGAVL